MGTFDRFRQKPPPPEPPQRILASLRKVEGKVELSHGKRVLNLDALPEYRLAWLAGLSPPILIEADIQTVGEERRVTGLGSVQPHPRVAALRAVADFRFGQALESMEILGEEVEDDLELLSARLRAHVGLNRIPDAEADFGMICSHPNARAPEISQVFAALRAVSTEKCGPLAVSRISALAISNPAVSLRHLLSRVPLQFWSLDALLRVIDEALSEKVIESWDLEDAKNYLASAQGMAAADPRVLEAAERVAKATAKIAKREKKQAATLLASRPNFDDVESLFSATLPKHLRHAWEAHYEGETVGFGFFPAPRTRWARSPTSRASSRAIFQTSFAVSPKGSHISFCRLRLVSTRTNTSLWI